MAEEVRTRRRGEVLEAAILDAAWQELVEVGFPRLTMESVATRAETSVPVLYRRWAGKDVLVIAAIERYRATHPVHVPDTGSLRGDLLGLMTEMNEGRLGFTTVITSVFAGLLADSGLTPDEIRTRILENQPRLSDAIFRRAHERGEIDLDRLPASVLAMPFDLIRQDLLMTLKPVAAKRIVSIVDELFLPLAARRG
ncbi:TetR/AcrR family transcriptional regulator [Parafrigoribacterium soli]|uniref:TetR/AcrR family transcriptional regulator n=1 Tax=Parafrigoribacterium soli TaxID=3144663 RepID=UPI0032EC420E